MPADPITELRRAAELLAADGDPVSGAVAAWLDGVAERMVAGGWVLIPDRNHALKIARAVSRRTPAP
ncbi:hypothetical protein [Embleya sp. NPDC005971]|uniref:hypothetical protein n=1 Tax=Embleya sp. NPDC005971 TaxID=3156724 RepID=UPI0033EA231B